MSELRQHIQDELKKGRIEALKSCTYEQICDLLDSQEKQMNDLERQLEEARSNRYIEITAIRTRFESFMSGNWSAQEFRDYMKQLKEKG